MPSYPLDLFAEYTLAIGRDQANVWKVLLTEDQRTFGVGGTFEGVSAYTKVEKIPGTSSARKAS